MMEILAWAGILSAVAVLLREVRLMMGEVRRWIKPPLPTHSGHWRCGLFAN
jgi:hypothetical protein